jgi:hypothetical protein
MDYKEKSFSKELQHWKNNFVKTFITVCKSFQTINFLVEHWCIFSTDSKSASSFSFYNIHLEISLLPTLKLNASETAHKNENLDL